MLSIRRLGYIDKGRVVVIFFNYNFYLFKGETRKWILGILRDGIISRDIPISFVDYLKSIDLIASMKNSK